MIAANPFKFAAFLSKVGSKGGEYLAYYLGYDDTGTFLKSSY